MQGCSNHADSVRHVVTKRRRTTVRGPRRFDIPTLVADVEEAFKAYDPESLEKMWQHKSYVMGAVLATKPNQAWRVELPSSQPRKTGPSTRVLIRVLSSISRLVRVVWLAG